MTSHPTLGSLRGRVFKVMIFRMPFDEVSDTSVKRAEEVSGDENGYTDSNGPAVNGQQESHASKEVVERNRSEPETEVKGPSKWRFWLRWRREPADQTDEDNT